MESWSLILKSLPALLLAQAGIVFLFHKYVAKDQSKTSFFSVYVLCTIVAFAATTISYLLFVIGRGDIKTPVDSLIWFARVWLGLDVVICWFVHKASRDAYVGQLLAAVISLLFAWILIPYGSAKVNERVLILSNGEKHGAVVERNDPGGYRRSARVILRSADNQVAIENGFRIPDCPQAGCSIFYMTGTNRARSPHLSFLFKELGAVSFGLSMGGIGLILLNQSRLYYFGRKVRPSLTVNILTVLLFVIMLAPMLISWSLTFFPDANWPFFHG